AIVAATMGDASGGKAAEAAGTAIVAATMGDASGGRAARRPQLRSWRPRWAMRPVGGRRRRPQLRSWRPRWAMRPVGGRPGGRNCDRGGHDGRCVRWAGGQAAATAIVAATMSDAAGGRAA